MTMVDQNDIAADKYLKTDTITFEELPYIQKYQNLLRLPDKETSLKLFTKQEPEPQQIVILKTRHAENAGKIEKGLQRLKSLEGAIAAKQFQAEQDTAWLDRANMFKTRLLAILPPVFRKEGEIFLNRFIMENLNEDYKEISIPGASRRPVPGANYMPGAHPQKQGFPLKVKTLFYQQQLQKFRDEFNQTNNEYREYYPRFDITRPTETLKKEIAAKYDTAALQAEKGHINAELQRLTAENETISQNMNRLLAAIALKREKFAEIYSKRLFRTDFCDSGVAAALESGLLGGTETEKQYLATGNPAEHRLRTFSRWPQHYPRMPAKRHLLPPAKLLGQPKCTRSHPPNGYSHRRRYVLNRQTASGSSPTIQIRHAKNNRSTKRFPFFYQPLFERLPVRTGCTRRYLRFRL